MPDILLVDGGKGTGHGPGGAPGTGGRRSDPARRGQGRDPQAGAGNLYLNDASHEFTLPADSPALHLIQQIRDEAHRFAITGHRARRGKARRTSTLEDVPGVGPKRRRDLLKYFGGLQELSRASIDELAKAPVSVKSLPSRFMPSCTASRMPAHLAA